MILARICNDKGIPQVLSGSCQIERYNGKNDGWFPIDSFDFGFNPKQDDSNDPNAGHPAPAAAGKQPAPGQPAAGAKGAAKKEFAEVAITKPVDTATISLMVFAMRERKTKKGVGEKSTPLSADIHVISSVTLEKLQSDRFHYTSLMIHLEAVNVQSWKINASGDNRPTENVSLRYDRAAMIYVSTSEGKTFHVVGPNGWDQTANKDFQWNDGRIQEYLPPLQSLV